MTRLILKANIGRYGPPLVTLTPRTLSSECRNILGTLPTTEDYLLGFTNMGGQYAVRDCPSAVSKTGPVVLSILGSVPHQCQDKPQLHRNWLPKTSCQIRKTQFPKRILEEHWVNPIT